MEQNIKRMLDISKQLILIKNNEKTPIKKGWVNNGEPYTKIQNHIKNGGNVGWALGTLDLVIDIDPRNGGIESYARLCENLGIESLTPTVCTPSGGTHIYLKHASRNTLRKNLWEYPGIDFLSKGMYCLIPPSKIEGNAYEWDFLGFEQTEVPSKLIEALERVQIETKSHFSLHSREEISEILSHISPDLPNAEWVKIGMALQHWDNVEGLKLWEEWSKPGKTYREGECAKRWQSFQNGHKVTVGSLFHYEKLAEYEADKGKIQKYIDKISVSDMKTIDFDILPLVRSDEMDVIDRERIAVELQTRVRELTGVKLPIAEAREKVKEKNIDWSEAPDWCREWVYVNSHASFVNINTLTVHKAEAFNVMNGKHIETDSQTKPTASRFVSDRGLVEVVEKMEYFPYLNYGICEVGGKRILNAFDSRTVPKPAREYTPEGREAIKFISNHIKMLCGEEAETFTQWLAFQVQKPGEKILWSPVIQSIQGVGKSFFGELLRQILGYKNIGTVSPSQITSNFNGWATGVAVNVLEELRVKGHNRYDVINALKPLITDRFVQINEKNVKPYIVHNVTNYLCFTNYRDAIPVDADDRRWWVIFVDIDRLEDIEKHSGLTVKEYFGRLFESLQNHSGEVSKWLREYQISKEFMDTKQAPMTDSKASMIATEEASMEGLDALKELIESGGPWFNTECLSSADLFAVFELNNLSIDLNNRTKNMMLKKLGYMALANPIKLDGKTRRIWAKRPMVAEHVRETFEKFNKVIL